jgi:signal transduction histidine kinase
MIARLTTVYTAIFAAVLACISGYAYWLIGGQYRGLLAPALDTPEGRAGYRTAMTHVLTTIVAADVPVLVVVGLLAYVLARASLRPLFEAREREQQFAADAAHELRSPLATIATVAQAARLKTDDATRDQLDTIARTALDASALIGDLLTLAREPRAGLLQREPVDLAHVVATCAREFEARAAAEDLELRVVAGGAIVNGDERRLRELTRNLLENALRHAKHEIVLECGGDGTSAYLRVRDDGEGIAPALREQLFQRYAGADAGGHGLGLSIAQWIASAHDGKLELEGSTSAPGASFVAKIPRLP